MKAKTIRSGRMFWVTCNSKVSTAILNLGGGLDCPSRSWCPFDRENYWKSGRPLCYAQRTETCHPIPRENRRANAQAIRDGEADPVALAADICDYVRRIGRDHVRMNEAGDLSAENIAFACAFVAECRKRGVTVYTYSKSPKPLRERLRAAGAVVLDSESDFICVDSEEEAQARGLTVCPGEGCGSTCLRCPQGMRTAVVAH